MESIDYDGVGVQALCRGVVRDGDIGSRYCISQVLKLCEDYGVGGTTEVRKLR